MGNLPQTVQPSYVVYNPIEFTGTWQEISCSTALVTEWSTGYIDGTPYTNNVITYTNNGDQQEVFFFFNDVTLFLTDPSHTAIIVSVYVGYHSN